MVSTQGQPDVNLHRLTAKAASLGELGERLRDLGVEVHYVGSVGRAVQCDTVTEYHVVPVHPTMCKYTIIPRAIRGCCRAPEQAELGRRSATIG